MSTTFHCQKDCAVVQTDNGPIRGYQEKGLSIFKGIPYAKARRFHQPEELESWTEPLETTSYGYVCPLIRLPKPTGELLVPHRYWPMDEDCLNLNIWTPGCDRQKLPVLVWLHGGGFSEGSSIEQIAYDGENMSRLGDAVVVSINHRLNILGYFDLSHFGKEYENSANAGTADIVAALRWIQKNIAAFGGDPGNVTVFGQSGGGAKVTALLQTPAADGLFHQGVNMSGVLNMMDDAKGDGEELANALMQEMQISTVVELEQTPWQNLFRAYKKVSPALRAAGKNVGCLPMKNAYYLGNPMAEGFRRETTHIPMLIGSVFGEFSSFMPLPFNRETISEAESAAILSSILGDEAESLIALFKEAYPKHKTIDLMQLDCFFRSAGMQYIRKRAAFNHCTYSYLMDLVFPIDEGRMAWHCSDIPLFFHNTELLSLYRGNEVLQATENDMFQALMAFARTGNPACNTLPAWQPCTEDKEYTMLFTEQPELVANHDEKLIPLLAARMAAVMGRTMAANADKIAH